MDIFNKCYSYNLDKLYKDQNLYPYFRVISSTNGAEVTIDQEEYLMLGSNSYLSLTQHPKIIQAAVEAIHKYGTGNAGSRFLNGTLDIHEQLESKLALFAHKESALLYGTGWMANVGAVSSIAGFHDIILCDRMNHSSLYDGSKLAMAKKVIKYKHNDMNDLEIHIKRARDKLGDVGILIISDGVFSMEGDIVDLPNLVKIAKKYDARILIDDAHSVGVLGPNGEGTAAHFGLTDEVDIITYTFSKSLASLGGAVIASQEVINYMKHVSRPVVFSASIPASAAATVICALDILKEESFRMKRLWEITHKMHQEFKDLGFDTSLSQTPIIPLVIGGMDQTFTFWKYLQEAGIFVNPVVPPAVPPNQCLIRTSYMSEHTDEQLQRILSTFMDIGKKLKVI